jgi:hypothetical protein
MALGEQILPRSRSSPFCCRSDETFCSWAALLAYVIGGPAIPVSKFGLLLRYLGILIMISPCPRLSSQHRNQIMLSRTHIRLARSSGFSPTHLRRFHSPFYRQGSGPIDPEATDDPDNFDVLVSDVNYLKLREEISKRLGIGYLSRVPKLPELQKPSSEIKGILYGVHHRPLFALATSLESQGRSRYVHFLFDSGSPFTYFSYEVSGNHTDFLLLVIGFF